MLLLSKSKQKNIEEFCEMFGNNITMFEKYQSKLLPHIIEAEQKLKRQLNDEEQAEIYAKILKEHNMDILKTVYKPKLDNSRDLESKLQEYFTNNTLAEYILTKSSIKSNTSKINVLEPTAGDGALVRPILKLGKDATVDMVEIDLNNRSKLKELVSLSPASLSLKEQGNFAPFPHKQPKYSKNLLLCRFGMFRCFHHFHEKQPFCHLFFTVHPHFAPFFHKQPK
jgi:hypothetical protein